MVRAPEWAQKPLALLGLAWPDGDPAQLAVMATDWRQFAADLRQLHDKLNGAVEGMVTSNIGTAVNAMNDWWHKERGPSNNLLNLASAADDVADSLRFTGTKLAVTQYLFLLQLEAALPLVSALAVTGVGTAVSIALARARRAAAALVVALVTLLIAYSVYERVQEKVKPIEGDPPVDGDPPVPRRTPTPAASVEPSVLPSPNPTLPPDGWPEERPTPEQEKCSFNGNRIYTSPRFAPGGAFWDKRFEGTGIVMMDAWDNADGSHSVAIDGVIKPTIARSFFEAKWPIARESVGLPPKTYDAAHLFGPIWGSEAAEGLLFAPSGTNRGAQLTIEEHIKWLNQQASLEVDQNGRHGFVEVGVYANSHGKYDWKNPGRDYDYGGYLLLRRADYNVRVCHPDGQGGFNVVGTEHYTVNIGVPDRYGNPGAVTHSPLPPRH